MATSASPVTSLPPGYTVETPQPTGQQGGSLPAGYTVETASQQAPQPSLGQTAAQGVKNSVVGTVAAPPDDATEHIIHGIGGDGALATYRTAKGIVDTAENAMKTKGDAFRTARDTIANLATAGFYSNAQNTANDVTQLAKGNAEPIVREGVNAGAALLGGKLLGEEGAAESKVASDANVVESKVASETAKTGLQPGDAAAKPEEIQAVHQQGIRDVWNKVAAEEKVPAPKSQSVRDAGQQVGDAIYDRSKANFKLVDDATDGKFQPNADKLRNAQLKLRDIAGTDEKAEEGLVDRILKLESQQDQLFDDAAAKGVSKDVVDKARADYKKANAIYDVQAQIRATTTGVRPSMEGSDLSPETVNAKSLGNRLNKMWEPDGTGRLQQAVGTKNAEFLINDAATAEAYNAVPASGQKAFAELIKPNTKVGGVLGKAKVDWQKSLNDFHDMTPQERAQRFGQSSSEVEDILRTQARNQVVRKWIKGGIGTLAGAGTAAAVWDLFK